MKDKSTEIPYLRVGTTILKRVLMPLSNRRSLETLIVWNRRQTECNRACSNCRGAKEEGEANVETLRQDFGKDYIAKIPKYDGFCTVPSHTDYRREIHGFLNRYEPISTVLAEGEFASIREFLSHIFEEHI